MTKLTKRFLIGFWSLFFLGLATVAIVLYLICNGKVGNMPPIEDLQNPQNKYASEIYSSDGVVLGRFFESKENRVYVPYSDLSQNLVKALIATEDARYNEHSGIDFESLGRVLVKTVIMRQKNAGGGSTITQQLAKLLFTEEPATSLLERAKQKALGEWVIAVKLEKLYTKEEIIMMYLNKFDFGMRVHDLLEKLGRSVEGKTEVLYPSLFPHLNAPVEAIVLLVMGQARFLDAM